MPENQRPENPRPRDSERLRLELEILASELEEKHPPEVAPDVSPEPKPPGDAPDDTLA